LGHTTAVGNGLQQSRGECQPAGQWPDSAILNTRSIPDKDKVPGSSPGRPTTPRLSCGNARPYSFDRGGFGESPAHSGPRTHPCTAVLRRLRVESRASGSGQVLWRVRMKVVGESVSCGGCRLVKGRTAAVRCYVPQLRAHALLGSLPVKAQWPGFEVAGPAAFSQRASSAPLTACTQRSGG
jgi:hypothetical protein